jgi:hypothetical protein
MSFKHACLLPYGPLNGPERQGKRFLNILNGLFQPMLAGAGDLSVQVIRERVGLFGASLSQRRMQTEDLRRATGREVLREHDASEK